MIRRGTLVAAILIVLAASWMITNRVKAIEQNIAQSERLAVSSATDEHDPTLDRPMLTMEIPQGDGEVTSLAPPAVRGLWRAAVAWDFLFIIGYVVLFWALPFNENAGLKASVWETVTYLAVAAGLVDCAENVSMLTVLNYLDEHQKLVGTAAFTVLPIFGTVKWLFFFFACRALALNFASFSHWRWLSVALLALVTAGTWAAIFSFAGMPARPVLGLVASATSLLLAATAIMRLVKNEPGPRVSPGRVDQRGEAVRFRTDSTRESQAVADI